MKTARIKKELTWPAIWLASAIAVVAAGCNNSDAGPRHGRADEGQRGTAGEANQAAVLWRAEVSDVPAVTRASRLAGRRG
jgi:hypothetical protein